MATSRRLPLVPSCTADCCRFSAKPSEESTQLQPAKKIPAVVDTLFKKSLRVGMVPYLFLLLSAAHSARKIYQRQNSDPVFRFVRPSRHTYTPATLPSEPNCSSSPHSRETALSVSGNRPHGGISTSRNFSAEGVFWCG